MDRSQGILFVVISSFIAIVGCSNKPSGAVAQPSDSTPDYVNPMAGGTQGQAIATAYGLKLFEDVNWLHPAFNAAHLLYQKSITRGCREAPFRYCPDDLLTRGQISVFVVRTLFGETFEYEDQPYFADVPSDHIFFKYVQKMKELQITSGCSDQNYCPDDQVTRGQLAVFLARAKLGLQKANEVPQNPIPFKDVPINHLFYNYIQNLATRVLGGRTLNARCISVPADPEQCEFHPGSPVSRADAATLIANGFFAEDHDLLAKSWHQNITFTPSPDGGVSSHETYFNVRGGISLNTSVFQRAELFGERLDPEKAKDCEDAVTSGVRQRRAVSIRGIGVIMVGVPADSSSTAIRPELRWAIYDPTIHKDKSLRVMIDMGVIGSCEVQ